MTKSKRFVIFLILFLGVAVLFYIIRIKEISHVRQIGYPVNPIGHLTVDIEYGTITIETTDQHHVDITARKDWHSKFRIPKPNFGKWIDDLLEDFEFTIEHNDSDTESDVRVEGNFKRGREYWQEGLKWLTIDVHVTVPRQYNVTLKTASGGDIYVGDLMGTISAEVLGGNLHLGEIQGEVWGKTGVNGDITLKGGQSSVNLTTAMGNIRAEMTAQPQHPWTLHASMDGAIDVTLRPDIALDIDAQTDGKISSDPSIQFQGDLTENRLIGTLNGGGPLLKLSSPAGDIRLKRQ